MAGFGWPQWLWQDSLSRGYRKLLYREQEIPGVNPQSFRNVHDAIKEVLTQGETPGIGEGWQNTDYKGVRFSVSVGQGTAYKAEAIQ